MYFGEVVHITFVATTRHEEKKRQGDTTMSRTITLMETNEYRALVNRYWESMAGQDDKTIKARVHKAEVATFESTGHPLMGRRHNTAANRLLWAHCSAIVDAAEQRGVRS